MKIFTAQRERLSQAAALASELWPGDTLEGHLAELEAISPDEGVVFLVEEDGTPAGFAQCRLRHDYVEGTRTSPVGYLEGIYIREAFRRRGAAKALLRACESWAAGQGCTEFASDCELGNTDSAAFHLAADFAEANRIVCFVKQLGEENEDGNRSV